MKAKLILSAIAISASICMTKAQGLINNGSQIVVTGPVFIMINGATGHFTTTGVGGYIRNVAFGATIDLQGNWNNNGGNTACFNPGCTVRLSGAAQTINGLTGSYFYNLQLLGTGTKTFTIYNEVGNVLSLGTRPLDLNGNYVYLSNNLPAAITTSGGYIISETPVAGNPSIVRWLVGTNNTAHTIPFGTFSGISIPFTFTPNITAPNAFSLVYTATRPTAASDNLPWSTGVTHMFDPNLAQDGSDEAVIDRWWDFTFNGAANPDFTFSYRGLENTLTVPYNTGNIGAQYWSAAWLPNNAVIGSAAAVLAGVGTVTANAVPMAANAFTPMVLSSVLAPLPIELTRFDGTCTGNGAFIHWTTATETNSDYFTLQRSDDGQTFRNIGMIQAAGNSSSIRNYSYADTEPLFATTYYRLLETDIHGQSKTASVITIEPCTDKIETVEAWSAGNDVTVLVNAALDQDYVVELYDNRGRLVFTQKAHAQAGANKLDLTALDLVPGVYFVNIQGTTVHLAEKLYITRD
jgi:hypothetical protein